MRVWRICRSSHAEDPLDGRGGLYASGRWHHKGRRIVYCSETLSLAALEVLVHFEPGLSPTEFIQVEIDIPDELRIRRIDLSAMPRGWRRYPAPGELQRLGSGWLVQPETAVLQVPSAIIPAEQNYLLNPDHPDAARIAVVSTDDFLFDLRLLR